MSRSRYENRAKLINKGVAREDTLPPAMSRDDAWARVKSKKDVQDFYQLYYPHLPDILCTAIADMYSKAVEGQIELPENYLKKNPKVKVAWDFEKEIQEAKTLGKINNSIKHMEELSLVVMPDPQEKSASAVVAQIE